MTEEESIETFKSWLEYNKKNKNILREADTIIAVQETILNLIQKLQEENLDVKKEVEKKDKIIDLMAEELENQFLHCKPCWLDKEVECKNYSNCIDCIIQYFKNKAIQEEN